MIIRPYEETDRQIWDAYVNLHPDAYHAHLIGWKDVIEQTYNKKSYYLVAEESQKIVGVLPLFHIKSFLFGNTLVSMPYLTYGGVLANNELIERALVEKALEKAKELGTDLEFRQINTPVCFRQLFYVNNTKVSMRLELPNSGEVLFLSFKAKLRSQIRRPQKENMIFKLSGEELINDFYEIFAINMRDLGSPVHGKQLFNNLLKILGKTVKVGVVYYGKIPVAAGIITIFNKYIEIPWASSLREYNALSPNMLLYWGFLEYSANNNFETFDFGRSTVDESSFRFKKQWGSMPVSLNWYLTRKAQNSENDTKKRLFISVWNKLPLNVTNLIGPCVRKGISL